MASVAIYLRVSTSEQVAENQLIKAIEPSPLIMLQYQL